MLGLLTEISGERRDEAVASGRHQKNLPIVRGVRLMCALMAATAMAVEAESLQVEGGEVAVLGALTGEQVRPHVAYDNGRGVVVFEDNRIDGQGSGIGGALMGAGLTQSFAPFRVNSTILGDQSRPRVAMLPEGGAVIVWESVEDGRSVIRARFLNPDTTFVGGDLIVSSSESEGARRPALAVTDQGKIVVVWSSFGQDDSGNISASLSGLQGVYARMLTADGGFDGDEFLVNQSVIYNQRDPAVVARSGGGFSIAWISEGAPEMGADTSVQEFNSGGNEAPFTPVDVYLRHFSVGGVAMTGEQKISQGRVLCANPDVIQQADGALLLSWSQNDLLNPEASWDVFSRICSTTGVIGDPLRVNSFEYGDQYGPKASVVGSQSLLVWTSLKQDGSFEGVFGQVLNGAVKIGDEFQVNAVSASKQIHPAVATLGAQGVAVVWSSFEGGQGGFDIKGKAYYDSLPPAPKPFVTALSQSKLSVTWPDMESLDPAHYLLYINDADSPVEVDGLYTQVQALAPGSEHAFRLAYRMDDGRVSPLSESVTGRTLGEDGNFDGLPDDWQVQYFGENRNNWPDLRDDVDGDGASTLDEFLAGTSPTDAESVLRQQLIATEAGFKLQWNAIPGMVYQVETSGNLIDWSEFGKMRFAHGFMDELTVNLTNTPGYFRVRRLR